MKVVKIFLILFLASCQSKKDKILSFPPEKQKVHICISPDAERYHYDENCRGFNNCTHATEEVTITEAKSRGYTECRMEN